MGKKKSFWDSTIGNVLTVTPPGFIARTATDEDFRSRIPVVNSLTGAESNEQKNLVKKQQQLAEEARKRRLQMQDANMNALGQSMLAFAPRNQMMAQMFGPDAAFKPEQFAAMAQNPIRPQLELSGSDYRGRAPKSDAEKREEASRQRLAE
jgi:hypothetical protein